MTTFPELTQEQAAVQAGVSPRTICYWECSAWWPEAQAEARHRWLRGVEAGAMSGIDRALLDPDEYASMAKFIAERRLPELRKPSERVELMGKDGGPITIEERREALKSAVARLGRAKGDG